MCVAACYDEYVNCIGKRKYELRISTDCDEPVRLISWKYIHHVDCDNMLCDLSSSDEVVSSLSQSSDDQLDRYCNMLLMTKLYLIY